MSRLHRARIVSLRPVTVAFSLVLLFAIGCKEEQAKPEPQAPKVSVLQPQRRQLTENMEYNGWMEAERTVEVRARVRGHIHKVHFTDGQIVKKGDPLFDLDPRPFQVAIDRQKDKVKVYQAQKVAADKEFTRLSDLQKKGGASVAQVDKAEADAKALDAEIAATMEEIKRAELEKSYATVTAEIGGRISKAELTEGNLVNAGGSDPLLTTIRSLDPINLYFNIDERLLQRFAKGASGKSFTETLAALKDGKVNFTFRQDGESDFSHKAVMSFGDNRIDPTTGTIQVYGTVKNPDGKYVPGARVRVRLPIGKEQEALLVPETAILADQDQRYVLIVNEKNEAKRRNVTLGTLTDDGMRAITPADKLEAGENAAQWAVIVDNLQRVRVNFAVDPQKPAAAKSPGS